MRNKPHAPGSSRQVLDRHRQDLSRCVRCGSCSAVCPSFLANREESRSPRGRMAMISAVLEGRLPVSKVYGDRLETCTGCLACEDACPSGVPVTTIIQAAREQAVAERGPGIVKSLLTRILSNEDALRASACLAPLMLHYRVASVRGGPQQTRPRRIVQASTDAEERERKGRVVFFSGCAINYHQPGLGQSAVSILSRIGYQVIIPDGLQCCGRPLLSLGDRKAAGELAAKNAALLAAVRADAIVTACASCALTFTREYPKLLGPAATVPLVLDLHGFLAAQRGRFAAGPVNRTITWHDSCHLGRGLGLAKTARELLRSIPGIRLVEMRNPDRCCGFGGVMRLTHHGISDGIADAKAGDIIATRADAVVTGCPGCRMQIADGLRRAGSDIAVLHTVQVIEEALASSE